MDAQPVSSETPVSSVSSESSVSDEALLDVDVRLWAELGRAHMPLGDAVALSAGSVVDLDRQPEEPVDVYVNGHRYATGRLVLVDGEWAVRIESVL